VKVRFHGGAEPAMRLIGDIGTHDRSPASGHRLAQEILVGFGCAGLAAVTRVIVDQFVPSTPPFAFAMPAVLLAAVLAGWRAGLLTLAIAALGVWFAVIPPRFAAKPLDAEQATTLIVNTLAGLLIVLIAYGLRRTSERAEKQRSATLESRELLLRELNHRIKNNFQMVAGLLEMQRRTAAEPTTAQALEGVIVRVHSLAQAHAALYAPSGDIQTIDFARYVDELCRSLSDSLLLTTIVQLRCTCEPATMSADRAAALGLVINELVTNAVKHAFPDGRSGTIEVIFARTLEGWRLTVKDDGVGMPKSSRPSSGVGRRLIDAFARQAGGTVSQGPLPGCIYHIDLPD
jgi:two-component sensor histidine kinase